MSKKTKRLDGIDINYTQVQFDETAYPHYEELLDFHNRINRLTYSNEKLKGYSPFALAHCEMTPSEVSLRTDLASEIISYFVTHNVSRWTQLRSGLCSFLQNELWVPIDYVDDKNDVFYRKWKHYSDLLAQSSLTTADEEEDSSEIIHEKLEDLN